MQDLTFNYLDATTGAIVTGSVEYLTAMGIAGDYNDNGIVDAADYVVWRKALNTTSDLPNDDIGGTIGMAHYDQWRAHFGQSAASSDLTNASVPEPRSYWLLLLGVILYIGKNAGRFGKSQRLIAS